MKLKFHLKMSDSDEESTKSDVSVKTAYDIIRRQKSEIANLEYHIEQLEKKKRFICIKEKEIDRYFDTVICRIFIDTKTNTFYRQDYINYCDYSYYEIFFDTLDDFDDTLTSILPLDYDDPYPDENKYSIFRLEHKDELCEDDLKY